jgi:hypothetical protein
MGLQDSTIVITEEEIDDNLDISQVWRDVGSDTSSKMSDFDQEFEEEEVNEEDAQDSKGADEGIDGDEDEAKRKSVDVKQFNNETPITGVAHFTGSVITHNRRRVNKIFSFTRILIFLVFLFTVDRLSGNRLYTVLLPWFPSMSSPVRSNTAFHKITESSTFSPLVPDIPLLEENPGKLLDEMVLENQNAFQSNDFDPMFQVAVDSASESSATIVVSVLPSSPLESKETSMENKIVDNLEIEYDISASIEPVQYPKDNVDVEIIGYRQDNVDADTTASQHFSDTDQTQTDQIYSPIVPFKRTFVVLFLFCCVILILMRIFSTRKNGSQAHDEPTNYRFLQSTEMRTEFNTPVKSQLNALLEDDRIQTRSATRRKVVTEF